MPTFFQKLRYNIGLMKIDWTAPGTFMILGVHFLALVAFFLPGIWHWPSILVFIITFYIKVFFIGAGYHRYFSHKTYKTRRWFQCLLAIGSQIAMPTSTISWQVEHRHHHAHSDQHDDVHSPWENPLTHEQNEEYKLGKGWMKLFYFLWSHVLWLLSDARPQAKKSFDKIAEYFLKFPEIRWLDRNPYIPFIGYAVVMAVLSIFVGWQLFVWNIVIGTVATLNATWLINSVTHVTGYQRFSEKGKERTGNIWWLWAIMLGENFHNNHHKFALSTRQGFAWWEIDVTYYILKLLSFVRVTWDLKEPTLRVMREALEEKLARLQQRLQKAMQEHKVRQQERLERLIRSVQEKIRELSLKEMQQAH